MNNSGQTLLIGVLLFIVILISVPSIIMLNRTGTQHGVASQQKLKGNVIAEEALSFAIQQLSSSTAISNPDQPPSTAVALYLQSGNNSKFISQLVPTVLAPRQIAPVKIVFKNNGINTWIQGDHQLGSQNPQDNDIWTPGIPNGRVNFALPNVVGTVPNLDSSDSIDGNPLNESKTFWFLITAPTVVGTYAFQRAMYSQANTTFFGEVTTNVTISVQEPPGAPPHWPYFDTGMPNAGTYPSAHGGSFRVRYSSAGLQGSNPLHLDYQVGILADTFNIEGKPVDGSSMYAKVSPRTLGVKLTSGLNAALALMMMRKPLTTAGLVVHWGPMALFGDEDPTTDDSLVLLSAALDTNRFPRKFAVGDITCMTPATCSYPRSKGPSPENTDSREYWANNDIGFSNLVDLSSYSLRAQFRTGGLDSLRSKNTGLVIPPTCPPTNNPCGYYAVGMDAAVFGGAPSANYTLTDGDDVIYIEGNAEFDGNNRMRIDLFPKGALIVNGNLTLRSNNSNNGQTLTVRIPPTARQEYGASGITMPCNSNWTATGGTCNSNTTNLGFGDTNGLGTSIGNGRIPFRGFLYVTGDLIVEDEGWLLNGAVRVDGRVSAPNTSGRPHLTILFDDRINRHIVTSPFELLIDEKGPFN